jgi:hypothetical protein
MKDGYILKYPPTRWEEGMLLGNGTLGTIAMCGTARETLILTHEWIYSPVFDGFEPPPMSEKLPEIRRLIIAGKYSEAGQLPDKLMNVQYNYKGQIWTNPFMPACDLIIQIPNMPGPITGYKRSLDFSSGIGTVVFENQGVNYSRECFVSRKDGIGLIRMISSKPVDYLLCFAKHPEDTPPNGFTHQYINRKLSEPEIRAINNSSTYHCVYTGRQEQYYTVSFCVNQTNGNAAAVEFRHGSLTPEASSVAILGATETVILFSLVKNTKEDPISEAKIFSYEELKKRHLEIHGNIYNRTALVLNNSSGPAVLDDEALWSNSKVTEKPETAFLEKIFSAGRYAVICATGKTPPNLQGIWTGKWGVDWSGDYTNDGNIQVAILGMLPSGFFEGMMSLFNYLEGFMEQFPYKAKKVYGCRGIHVPCRTSDSGFVIHFNEKFPMLYWTAAAAWFAHFYYDYWLYTGDDEFFKNRALPFMKEAALFYEDYLIDDGKGHWLINPSYSPENTPANSDSPVCINATMDIACAKELFSSLITGCRTLGIEYNLNWEKFLAKMPPYLTGKDGALKEWAVETLEEYQDHRHSSHLYMLYHDIPQDFKNDKALMAAARRAYEIRMEKRIQSKGTMAFGLIQCGMTAAHLGDGEMVGTLLGQMAQFNYYPTYASSHDAGPCIFNTDISGGLPALMMEALAQSSPVMDAECKITSFDICLLPALPSCMASGSIKGMRLRGGFSLDMEWKDGKVVNYNIVNTKNKPYTLNSIGGQLWKEQ